MRLSAIRGLAGVLVCGFVLVAGTSAAALSVTAEPPTAQVAGASEWREPTSLDEAASMVRRRLKDIRTCLDSSAVAAVHTDAWDVARLARAAPALAEKESRNLPVGGVAAVAKSAEELARSADRLHTLADAENVTEARVRLEEVDAKFRAFEAVIPARFVCPMLCEGPKVYAAPAECPVCKMKLKKITSDEYTVRVEPKDGPLEAGKTSTLVFRISDPTGAPVTNLEVVHEEVLHLLMVSEDLSWYAHEHPVPQDNGSLELEWAFPHPGNYTLFHDFTPARVGMQVVPVVITVPGAAPAKIPLEPETSRTKEVDGLGFTLSVQEPIVTGASTKLRYLAMQGNTPVKDLEPFMGAIAHLIIIKDDRTAFVHSHPRERGGHHSSKMGGPTVLFEAYFKVPGRYKAWAQFKRGGRGITVPFVFDVKPGKVHAEETPSTE